jgi:hypothetical protein
MSILKRHVGKENKHFAGFIKSWPRVVRSKHSFVVRLPTVHNVQLRVKMVR